MRQRLAVAACCFAVLVSGAAADTMAWKFSQGESFYSTEAMEMKMEMQMMGQTIPVETKSTTISKFTVKEVKPDGGVVLERKIERQKSESSQQAPGMDMDELNKKMEGATFIITLNPKMEVTKVEGVNELMKRLFEGNEQMEQLMKMSLNEETIKRSLEELFLFVPGKSVAAGDTWERKSAVPMGPLGSLKAATTYKYEGNNKVAYVSKLTFEPAKGDAGAAMPFKVTKADIKSDKAQGTITFDPAKNRLAENKAEMNLTMKMSAEAGGQEIEMDMQMEIKTTFKISDSKPSD